MKRKLEDKVVLQLLTVKSGSQRVCKPTKYKTLYGTTVPKVWKVLMKALEKECKGK